MLNEPAPIVPLTGATIIRFPVERVRAIEPDPEDVRATIKAILLGVDEKLQEVRRNLEIARKRLDAARTPSTTIFASVTNGIAYAATLELARPGCPRAVAVLAIMSAN